MRVLPKVCGLMEFKDRVILFAKIFDERNLFIVLIFHELAEVLVCCTLTWGVAVHQLANFYVAKGSCL